MAILSFKGVGVTALAGAVPQRVINNYEYTDYFPADQVKEVVDKVGIFERRFADNETCSSDLCFAAAEKLIEDNKINKEEIDDELTDCIQAATLIGSDVIMESHRFFNKRFSFRKRVVDVSIQCHTDASLEKNNTSFLSFSNFIISEDILLNSR